MAASGERTTKEKEGNSADDATNETTETLFNSSAQNLRNAVKKTVRRCLQELKASTFRKNLAVVHEKDPKSLEQMRKEFVSQTEDHIDKEIQLVFSELDFDDKLNALDRLRQNCGQHEKKWRPSGDAEQDLRAHAMEEKMKQITKLKEILSAEEKKSRELQVNVMQKRKNLDKLVDQVNDKMQPYYLQMKTTSPNSRQQIDISNHFKY